MQTEQSLQRTVTRLCIQCGLFLLQHGAESALVDELSTRLGLGLGVWLRQDIYYRDADVQAELQQL